MPYFIGLSENLCLKIEHREYLSLYISFSQCKFYSIFNELKNPSALLLLSFFAGVIT